MNLKDLLENAGYETFSYSGRGMYGAKCLAVNLDDNRTGELYANILENVDLTDEGLVSTLAEALRDMRTDALGKGTVVYFPGWLDNESGDDESEEDDSETEAEVA